MSPRDFTPAPTRVTPAERISMLEAEVERLAFELECARDDALSWEVRYRRAQDDLAAAAALADQVRREIRRSK